MEQVVALRKNGLLQREIAAEMGVCRASVAYCLRKMGFEPPPKKKPEPAAVAAVVENRQPLPAGHPLTWRLIAPGYAWMGSR